MNTSDWNEVKRIFAEACELAPMERSALLDQRCAGRPELRLEVEAYLRQHEQLAARSARPPSADRAPDPVTETAVGAPTDELVRRLKEHAHEKRRYTLRGEIARGGMGAILKVWDEDLRRHLAMKVILGKADPAAGEGTPAVDPKTLGRFLEEAQVTGQLDHPGIVPVHELGLDDEGRVYFTMKLVKGRDLKEIFKLVHAGQEGWNETRALGVILKACEALAYAHKKGVIHRDLKPANVMVGNFGEVYVMDWGVARVLVREDTHDIRIAPESSTESASIKTERMEVPESPADSPIRTMDGDVIGTPSYMAPEQARGEIEKLGTRSDVYSMGALLYHLLARHAPYLEPGTRAGSRALLAQVLQRPPAPLASERADLPPELVAICEKAMAREAAQRYPDTLELAQDLRAFLEQRVVGAYETGAWAEARKWVRRNRPLAASLATALLLLVAGLTVSLVFKARADEKERIATRKSNDVLSLSAIQDLKDLEDRADKLWPADPGHVPEYEAWLADARLLIEGREADPAKGWKQRPGLEEHEAQLAELRKRAKPRTAEQIEADRRASPSYATWEKESAKLLWMQRMLVEEPWPPETEVEAELARETLPSDAGGLVKLAVPLIDSAEDRAVYGSEWKGMLLARRAVAAATESEQVDAREALAWAFARCNHMDEALAEARGMVDVAQGQVKEQAALSLQQLQAEIARWTPEGGRAQRKREASNLALRVQDLERELTESRVYEFEESEDRWWHAQLAQLVASLRQFKDGTSGGLFSAGTSAKYGWGIARRIEFARTIRERSVDGPEACLRWAEASTAIAASPKYAGVKLNPQVGLLPLGPDPQSGLWEFAHLQSGEPPVRGADGKLSMAEETGLVLVLLPGGKYWMGAQKLDPAKHNYDPHAAFNESPVHQVELSPYFLSKYELTQAQWERFTGTNPSEYGSAHLGGPLHPVEFISWVQSMEVMTRLSLELPSEAQWENACRGGTETAWWTGAERESLRGHVNLADQTAARNGATWNEIRDWPDLDDGWPAHAPIGNLTPNSYGLHEMAGNVWEWCLDGYRSNHSASDQPDPVTPGTGSSGRVYRGGGYGSAASDARSAYRVNDKPTFRSNLLGLRPARRVDP